MNILCLQLIHRRCMLSPLSEALVFFVLICPDSATEPFLFTVARLVGEQTLLRAAGAFPFLAADFLNLRLFGLHEPLLHPFDFVQQQPPRQEPVQTLVPRDLAFHTQPGGPMQQHDAGRTLVHLLSPGAAGADERLLNLALAHAQGSHPLLKLRQLVR